MFEVKRSEETFDNIIIKIKTNKKTIEIDEAKHLAYAILDLTGKGLLECM